MRALTGRGIPVVVGTCPDFGVITAIPQPLRNVFCDQEVRDVERPRAAVYEVKYVGHSGNLFIRARGHDVIDFRPVKDPAALRWIAGVLREALGLGGEGGPEGTRADG